MKIIYTFTLESDEYDFQKLRNDLRLFAHMLYHSIYNYEVNGVIPLDINSNIVYNEIHDEAFYSGYYLDSDKYLDCRINYEPFIISDNSFGLTIVDGLIDERILNDLINQLLYMLKLDYRIKIDFVSYPSKNLNDERNRKNAMRLVFDKFHCPMISRKFVFSRRKTPNKKTICKSY